MVERDYEQISKEIKLTGFFSEYLPPCFSLNEKAVMMCPPSKCDLIAPYSFTMSRFNGNDARRTIFIPEIGAYLAAHQYMLSNDIIKELIEFTAGNKHSFSPILGDDDSIMRHEQSYFDEQETNERATSLYILNIGKKTIRAAGAKKVLKLDISNCYSSFYMHMMPAIFLGVEGAEAEYNKYLRDSKDPTISPIYLKYKKFDGIIRQQNLDRTNGLLPGVLSSKIIIESILSRIDIELEKQGLNFVRYVDDYEVFLYENEEQTVISIFSEILKKFGFALNSEKTEVLDFPYYIVKNFEKILGGKVNKPLSNEDMIDIFTTFFELEQEGTKGAIRYLLKCFEMTPPKTTAPYTPDLYKAYLLTVMANNERSLSKSCSLLISHNKTYPFTPADFATLQNILRNHISYKHDLEVLWLTYLLIETGGIKKGDDLIRKIVETNLELVEVLLLRRSLLTGELLSTIKEQAKSWLLLYELYADDVINEAEFVNRLNLKRNLKMYQKLKINKVHFVS